jgi:hypothetical protein
MTFEEFVRSPLPPPDLSDPLQALWQAKQGHWEKAHHLVQKLSSSDAAWVHAWLHRQEGDDSNADYWYHRAGKKTCRASLDQEWEDITRQLLDSGLKM